MPRPSHTWARRAFMGGARRNHMLHTARWLPFPGSVPPTLPPVVVLNSVARDPASSEPSSSSWQGHQSRCDGRAPAPPETSSSSQSGQAIGRCGQGARPHCKHSAGSTRRPTARTSFLLSPSCLSATSAASAPGTRLRVLTRQAQQKPPMHKNKIITNAE